MSYSRNNLFSWFSSKGYDELTAKILETRNVAQGIAILKSVSKDAQQWVLRVEKYIVEPLLTKTPDELCDLAEQDEDLAHLIIRTPRLLDRLGTYSAGQVEEIFERFAGNPHLEQYQSAAIANCDGHRLAALCQRWNSVRASVLNSSSLRSMIAPALLTALQDEPTLCPSNSYWLD